MPRTAPLPKPAAVKAAAPARIVRKTAVDMVVDELRERILSGALAAGAPLRQEALAEELGVSRIPLREAIRQLSSEGLLDMQAHRGASVSVLSLEEVREFFDLRLRLEPWLFREAVPKVSEEALAEAEQIIKRMDDAEARSWGSLNWQLHELLYAAAGRPLTLGIVRALHEKSQRYFQFQVMKTPIRRQARQEHLALVKLCRERRAKEAHDAMQTHITEAAEQILDIVARMLGEPQAR